jgi:hypothetical protein
MICRSCRVHILSRLSLSARPFPSTAKASPQWRIPQSSRRTYATAAGDSASTAETAAENGPNGKTAAVVSSVQGGMRLDGINYLKNKTEVVAMNDEEYPDWLWSLLDEKKEAGAHGGVDPSCTSSEPPSTTEFSSRSELCLSAFTRRIYISISYRLTANP